MSVWPSKAYKGEQKNQADHCDSAPEGIPEDSGCAGNCPVCAGRESPEQQDVESPHSIPATVLASPRLGKARSGGIWRLSSPFLCYLFPGLGPIS